MKRPNQVDYLYAAIDWSGTPDAPDAREDRELYVPLGLRVASLDAVNDQFRAWRTEFGFPAHQELHGYKLRRRPDILTRVAAYALEHAQVTAFLFDKQSLAEDLGAQVFDKPAEIAPATGLLICEQMLARGPLRQVLLDEDIAPNRRPAFNTQVKRKARELWPQRGVDNSFPKHHPSDKHSLIQLADMIAYVIQREAHGLSETAELRRLVNALRSKPENKIWEGRGDDLQPYL